MAKKRRKYTKEFKVDAVRMVIDQNRTIADVARSLGVAKGVLSQWKQNYSRLSTEAFPGNGRRTAHDEEVWQLKKKLARDKLKPKLGLEEPCIQRILQVGARERHAEWRKASIPTSGTMAASSVSASRISPTIP